MTGLQVKPPGQSASLVQVLPQKSAVWPEMMNCRHELAWPQSLSCPQSAQFESPALGLQVPDAVSQKESGGQESLVRQNGWQLPNTGGLTPRFAPTQAGSDWVGEGWKGQSDVV